MPTYLRYQRLLTEVYTYLTARYLVVVTTKVVGRYPLQHPKHPQPVGRYRTGTAAARREAEK